MSNYYSINPRENTKLRLGEETKDVPPVSIPVQFQKIRDEYPTRGATVGADGVKYTYTQYYSAVMGFAKSLVKIGFKPWDSVNIIGFNSYHYSIGFMGCIFAGGIASGVYTTNNPGACKYCAVKSNCTVVLCEGVKQLEKYLSIQNEFKPLCYIIYNEGDDVIPQSNIKILKWNEFMDISKDLSDDCINTIIKTLNPAQCCSLIYTSGTTGEPKVVMISHDNYVFTALSAVMSVLSLKSLDDIPNVDKRFDGIRIVSYLPLSHVAAQIVDFGLQLIVPIEIYFARPDALKGTLVETLKLAQPIIHLGVPRVWEKVRDSLKKKMNEGGCLKSSFAKWAFNRGTYYRESKQYGSTTGLSYMHSVANMILFKKIKTGLGMTKLYAGVSSAAPISKDVIEFFGNLTVPVYELFGQSESTGPIITNNEDNWKIGTVGKPIYGVTVKIDEHNGELMYYGRNCFMGYKDNLNDTKSTIDDQGYVHTGDIASIDSDGFISITGRIKELIITAGGENVTPTFIEDQIKVLMPSLSYVVVIGDKLKFLSLLITFKSKPDEEGNPSNILDTEVEKLAREIGSTVSSIDEISNCPKFKGYINDKIDYYNKHLAISQPQNIRKWCILSRDFSLSTGELTPTLKLKRNVVVQLYNQEILDMYKDVNE